MTPPVAVLIPFYVLYVQTNLVDSYAGLIIAHVALNLSIAVWLMKASSRSCLQNLRRPP
jgi:multiple sugar transport system permease protein